MEQTIQESKLDSSWIIHDDSLCGKHWNPALYDSVEISEMIEDKDGVGVYYGVKNRPINTPRPMTEEYIEKPMSMFARANSSKISAVTLAILSQ